MATNWRRSLVLAVGAAAVSGAAPAGAGPVDLMSANGADYVGMNVNDRGRLELWLVGSFAGGARRPVLAEICGKGPQVPLIGAETCAVFIPAPAL